MNSTSLITFIVACAIGVGSESLIHAYLHSGESEPPAVPTPDVTTPAAPSKPLSNPGEEKVELLKEFDQTARS